MATFRVKADWHGYAVGSHYLVYQSTSYKRFMTTEYLYDLDVSNTRVDLAGSGTPQIDDSNDEIITRPPLFSIAGRGFYVCWFSFSEVADRFDGQAEGWRVRSVACAEPPAADDDGGPGSSGDEAGGSGEGGVGELPDTTYVGVELRFKGHIDSGTISTTFQGPTATITVGDQEVTVPVGPATTTTTGGATKDCAAKYRLCPDGLGDYTVAELEPVPAADTVVLVSGIKLKEWTHVK